MKKNVTLGGIRTRDLSFTTLNSNREVTGLNPSEGNSIFSCPKICQFFGDFKENRPNCDAMRVSRNAIHSRFDPFLTVLTCCESRKIDFQ